ncbi:MAG TPA: hypothetical protein VJZ68_02950 [Nitrososphaera sp.]|nr:hypothetical protein [Nitrososphaera sp.]
MSAAGWTSIAPAARTPPYALSENEMKITAEIAGPIILVDP